MDIQKSLNGVQWTTKKNSDGVQYIDAEHDHIKIRGYKLSWTRSIIAWTTVGLTFGLLYLLFHWQPRWKLLLTHVRCSLSTAQKLLILETYQGKWKTYRIKEIFVTDVKNRFQQANTSSSNGNLASDPLTIYLEDGSCRAVMSYRWFRNKKLTYIWDETRKEFIRLIGMESSILCSQFHTMPGYSAEEQAKIRIAYGENEIQVPVQTILTLLVLEFFNPFYMFQLFTIGVWLAENYMYYCIAIVIMSVFGITTSVIQTRKNQVNLKSTVHSVGQVQVCRDRSSGVYEEICSSDLVPGDVILIPPQGCTMHVDAVLLDGSCIVNESMLTGESVPVTKIALPSQNRHYSLKEDSNHTLYSGTKVIQTRYYKDECVRAVVIRTGFLTTKGELVRSIMYPLPADFKFDKDSYKFIIILSVLSFFGLLYTIILKSGRGITVGDIIIKSLDIITIVVPPALPAAMTVGRLYAISRLKAHKIFCINPRVINVCGSISCICFDKTGTLTEDGLDMWGVIPVRLAKNKEKFDAEDCQNPRSRISSASSVMKNALQYEHGSNLDIRNNLVNGNEEEEETITTDFFDNQLELINRIAFGTPVRDPSVMKNCDLLKIGMNVCHGLTILDNELSGDPLDIKMFESTGWILEEPKVPDNSKFDLLVPTVVRPPTANGQTTSEHEWGIVQQFQFNSSLQRCSVICKSLDSTKYMTFCKGSPEMIAALSRPESVPSDIKSTLRHYTQQGYRVLAMGCRQLQDESFLRIQRLTRDQVETDLIFLGLVVLENRLKAQSAPVIAELHEANVKIVMITGDNLDTAVSVAAECGLLKREEKLILCEAVPSTEKGAPPELYYTSSMINLEGLKQSNPLKMPMARRISTKAASSDSITNAASDTALCENCESASSLSLDSIENGIANKKYKIGMIGATWKILREFYPELIPKLITRGAIFARMSSDQKQQLVQELQALGYYVAMCGDGANDCGALKTAHVGISVSGEESSVASPFTSQEDHIGCVPLVVREGRAALVTSFGMFKFMVSYSITEFISVAMLYYFDSNLTDFQFMYIDLLLIVTFAFVFGKTSAYPGKLHKKPPETSLLGFVSLFSLTVHLLLVVVFQVSAYYLLRMFDWFVPNEFQGDIAYLSFENYGIFCVSMFQYITLVIAFSQGKPYRKGIWTNWIFMLLLLLITTLSVYITIYPANWLISLLELKMPPDYPYRIILVVLGFLNFFIGLIFEKVIVQYLIQERGCISRVTRKFPKSSSYQSIENELANSSNWPPLQSRKPSVIVAKLANERVGQITSSDS